MKPILRIILGPITTLLISLAILKVVVYFTAPAISEYREQVERFTAKQLGVPVQIKQLQVYWPGLLPKLQLQQVAVGEQGNLELGDVVIDLDPIAMLLYSQQSLIRITLDNTRIHIIRETNGETHIAGLAGSRKNITPPENLRIPAGIRLRNAEIVWEDFKHGGTSFVFSNVNLALHGGDNSFHLNSRLSTMVGQLTVIANLKGNILGTGWSGEIYAKTDNLDLASLTTYYVPRDYQLRSLQADMEVWSTWADGRHVRTQGELDLRKLKLIGEAGSSIQIDALSTDFDYIKQSNQWQLRLADFSLKRNDKIWPKTEIALRAIEGPEGKKHIRLGAGFLRIEDVAALLLVRPPSQELKENILKHKTQGDLRDARINVGVGPEGIQWQSAFTFSNLQTESWLTRMPALDNMSGTLRGNDQLVELKLDSTDSTLTFPKLFRDPLVFDSLQGDLYWQPVDGGGWSIDSRHLIANSPDLKTTSRIHLSARQGQSAEIDLQTDFHDGIASNAKRYYPTDIMSPNLVSWLDKSIVSGGVTSGSFVVAGPLKSFPYHNTHDGHFEVNFDAEDLILDYQTDWPPIKQLAANVRFHNNSLDIRLDAGRLYDSQIVQATAQIPRLAPASNLHIRGLIAGPLADDIRLLRESPLKKDFHDFVSGLDTSGKARLDLDFNLPLAEDQDYKLAALLKLEDAGLRLKEWNLPVEEINGTLNIGLDRLSADNIRASIFNNPLQIDVGLTDRNSTRITATGKIDLQSMQKLLPEIQYLDAEGQANFDIQLDIPGISAKRGTPTELTISSDLKGITVNLPTPLTKSADASRQLSVTMPVNTHKKALEVKLQDTLVLQASLAADLPAKINARIEHLPLSDWLEYIASKGRDDIALQLPDLDANLQLGKFTLGEMTIPGLTANLRYDAKGWSGNAAAKDFSGRFVLPADKQAPVTVDLDRYEIRIEPETSEPFKDEFTHKLSQQDPREFPAIIASSQHFILNGYDIGRLDIIASKETEGLSFDEIVLSGKLAQFTGRGEWSVDSDGALTRFSGTLSTPSLGKLSKQLGFDTELEDAATDMDLDLRWAGGPQDFSRDKLQGKVVLNIQQGRLLEVKPGAGRLLGLINFSALRRRLTLDFSDLYKKGFTFDEISGEFFIDDGNAYTENLVIKSPASRIDIEGRTGLADEDLDQKVTVIPHLDTTIPVASAIAGGPVAGVVALVAQQLLKDRLGKLQSFQYTIRGPWDDPEITRHESNGSLAKIFGSPDNAEEATQDATDNLNSAIDILSE